MRVSGFLLAVSPRYFLCLATALRHKQDTGKAPIFPPNLTVFFCIISCCAPPCKYREIRGLSGDIPADSPPDIPPDIPGIFRRKLTALARLKNPVISLVSFVDIVSKRLYYGHIKSTFIMLRRFKMEKVIQLDFRDKGKSRPERDISPEALLPLLRRVKNTSPENYAFIVKSLCIYGHENEIYLIGR